MKRLTTTERNEIYLLHQNKERSEIIAEKFSVTTSTINRVIADYNEKNGIVSRTSPPRKPLKDIMGVFFGELEVIERIYVKKRSPWQYRCKCHKCGSEDFIRTAKGLTERKNRTCGCVIWERKKGKDSPFFKGVGDIGFTFWNTVKKNAKLRNIDFDITLEYVWDLFLKQEKRCALSGVDITFGKSNYDETTASLDRIESNKGYCDGNVQWVHKTVNFMKHDLTEENLLYFCKNIVKWNRN